MTFEYDFISYFSERHWSKQHLFYFILDFIKVQPWTPTCVYVTLFFIYLDEFFFFRLLIWFCKNKREKFRQNFIKSIKFEFIVVIGEVSPTEIWWHTRIFSIIHPIWRIFNFGLHFQIQFSCEMDMLGAMQKSFGVIAYDRYIN